MRVLVIEDSELDYQMLLATLEAQGVPSEGLRVETASALTEALRTTEWDIVISDHCLPGFSSGQAFSIVQRHEPPPPFIIVSGMIGEEAAVEAMRRGVDDYLVKGRLARLGVAVRNAVGASRARREKALAETQLQQSQAQLRNLSTKLQTLIDAERTSIARDIHDDVGGTLTAIRIDLEILSRELGCENHERLRRMIGAMVQAQHATQRIIRNLRPPILDAGLAAALEWQLAQFRERHGVSVRFVCNDVTTEIPEHAAMIVYRACQEALTNIAKHAGATSVSVDLHQTDDVLSLEIDDNGRGLDAGALRKPDSLGLRGMAERVRAVKGELDISSVPGRTTLMLWVPLSTETVQEEATA